MAGVPLWISDMGVGCLDRLETLLYSFRLSKNT